MSTDFKWTENTVAEFIQTRLHIQESASFDLIEQFKASKQPKPEWEIIAYRHRPTGDLINDKSYCWDDAKYSDPNFKIFSVKRVSDNSIWSIGDKFQADASCNLTIKSFKVDGLNMEVWTVEYGYWMLNSIKKVLLLTTIDGVNIFEGDHYYFIDAHWKIRYTGDNHNWVGDGLKAFSTKEKAEAYRLHNAPVLSLKEISDNGMDEGSQFFLRLIQKAKDKLNLK